MLFIELFAPRGALSERRRRELSQRLVTEVVSAPGASPAMIEAVRAISQVVVHEPEAWSVAGRPLDPAGPARYVVRVSVPGGHLTEHKSAEIVKRISRVIRDADAERDGARGEPDVWVQVIGVAEGNWGVGGRVLRTPELIEMVVNAGRAATAPSLPAGRSDAAAPGEPAESAGAEIPGQATTPDDELADAAGPSSGTAVDPVCGMTVALATAVTLELDGTRYAFCCTGCRDVFLARRRRAARP